MKQLNGWTRFWIVLSIVTLGVVYGARSALSPVPASIGSNIYESLNRSIHCSVYWNYLGTENQIKKPENCYAKSAQEASQNNEIARKDFARANAELRADRREWWIVTLLIWFGVNLLAALAVVVGRWINQGFKLEKKP